MRLKILETDFSLCKVRNLAGINYRDPYFFIAKTTAELSLVCSTACVPTNVMERRDGFKAIVIDEILDFDLLGIIARISQILAEQQIPVFVVSTYNTDYFLVQETKLINTLKALSQHGYQIN